jgi:hypothetical protein
MQQQEAYPVRFTVDYPDRPLDRLTTGFRIVVAIPILIVLGTVSGGWTTATRHSVWPKSREATAVDRGPARQRERGPRPTARRATGMVQQLDL